MKLRAIESKSKVDLPGLLKDVEKVSREYNIKKVIVLLFDDENRLIEFKQGFSNTLESIGVLEFALHAEIKVGHDVVEEG